MTFLSMQSRSIFPLLFLILFLLASPAEAFGAGQVARGSDQRGVKFRHGDILYSVYFLRHAHSILTKEIYFGNWLRDFSQLIDRKSLEVMPEPILRAIVAIFGYIQFGYTTKEFEVTEEKLGAYRSEEHVDNPRGYEGGNHPGLRSQLHPGETDIDARTGMKNYIANPEFGKTNPTSLDYIEKQLVAAIACGRASDPEAYVHLGAALHCLEDFVAHSNWVELCMQMLGRDKTTVAEVAPGLSNVFAFTGRAASVATKRGQAPPLVTGTFGSLDLYQTLLGEVEDKLSAMTLPGLQLRMKGPQDSLSAASKALISLLGTQGGGFENEILSVTKGASMQPSDWGKLQQAPELLWQSLLPVFRLRDKIVRWVYEHLTVKVIADAVAAISVALDKLVYLIIGAFLGPVFQDVSAALRHQAQELLKKDQVIRLQKGEYSIFDEKSAATDPTHSQLCKDHYDHPLNELAGKVATKITTFTIKKVVEVWQPGQTTDVQDTLISILQTLHHPFNSSPESEIHSIMAAEVINWCSQRQLADSKAFATFLESLDVTHMAAKLGDEAVEIEHSQKSNMLSPIENPAQDSDIGKAEREDDPFVKSITSNIEKNLGQGLFKGLSLKDLPIIKEMLGATPSNATPNPIDQALIKIPGLGLRSAFDGIDMSEIMAAPGMGVILKDAVIGMRLQDEEWVAREQQRALETLGALEDKPVKEMLRLLDIKPKRNLTEQPTEEQAEESKARRMLNKVKLDK